MNLHFFRLSVTGSNTVGLMEAKKFSSKTVIPVTLEEVQTTNIGIYIPIELSQKLRSIEDVKVNGSKIVKNLFENKLAHRIKVLLENLPIPHPNIIITQVLEISNKMVCYRLKCIEKRSFQNSGKHLPETEKFLIRFVKIKEKPGGREDCLFWKINNDLH